MNIDLETIRKNYGMEKAEFADLIDMQEFYYSQYETRKELPSKYVYILWTKLKNFPVPADFFFYTSFVLEVNMRYHRMTQSDIAKMFDIANQSTISGYLRDNIPMYEKKEYFLKFKPLIMPSILLQNDKKAKLKEITDLEAKGNFILVEKRRIQKQNRIRSANAAI